MVLFLTAALARAADDDDNSTRALVFMVGGTAGIADIEPDNGHHAIVSLSPSVSGTWEYGGPALRVALTGCLTPTYWYAPARYLAFPSFAEGRVGFQADIDGLRVGGDLWVGLLSAGVGLHAGALPWTGRRGIRHGVDVRLDVLAGQYLHPRLMAQYAWTPWPQISG